MVTVKDHDSSAVLRLTPDNLIGTGKGEAIVSKAARSAMRTIFNPQTELYAALNALTPDIRRGGRLVAKAISVRIW